MTDNSNCCQIQWLTISSTDSSNYHRFQLPTIWIERSMTSIIENFNNWRNQLRATSITDEFNYPLFQGSTTLTTKNSICYPLQLTTISTANYFKQPTISITDKFNDRRLQLRTTSMIDDFNYRWFYLLLSVADFENRWFQRLTIPKHRLFQLMTASMTKYFN